MHTSNENEPQGYFADNPNFPSKTIVATLFIGAFFGYLNDTLLNVALTKIMLDFGVDKTTVQWLTTGFLLLMGALTPITANLIQWLDTRRMVLLTQAIFILGSTISMLAPTFSLLLVGRAFQAISAAFFVPILMNGILAIFPPQQRGSAMGVVTMMFVVAPAIGPTISGVIIDHVSWRYLFGLTIPFMLFAMWLVNRFLTVNLVEITRPKVDVISAIAAVFGFGGLVYASSSFNELSVAVFAGVLVGSLVIIAFFVKRQFSLETPLLDLSAFTYAQFRYALLILVCGYFIFMGLEMMLPMFTQQVLLLSGTATGLILMPASIAEAIAAPIFGKLLDKKGGRFLLIPSTLILLGSLVAMWAILGLDTNSLMLTALFTLLAIGIAGCITGETHGLNALPRHLNPHGASIIATLNPIAGALGAAFLVGITTIGEHLSQDLPAQEAMLNGVHLAMLGALVIAIIGVVSAWQIRANS